MTKKVSLWVNDQSIDLDYFAADFIDHTVGGMLGALKGTGEIGTLKLSLNDGEISLDLNNAQVPVNIFVSDIIRNTVTGMISTLKGVGKINSLKIAIER
ncbi:MAG: hypothetical protein Q7R57_01410 [Dehalococcoidales bacterium]|nr:hypothetical protein [Dehalococcoidales bacterium]